MAAFETTEDFARDMDERDPLRDYRERFHIPKRRSGKRDSRKTGPVIYFSGNSLGLQPKSVRRLVEEELDDWRDLALDAHFKGHRPWYSYHEVFRDAGARLVGARPGEVVMMNSLTVNLHLMLVTFYRPAKDRYRILIEQPAFPSDLYAVQTHVAARCAGSRRPIIEVGPRKGEHIVRTEDIEAVLEMQGDSISVVLIGGANFFTGQIFDMERITRAAHAKGCIVGFDLAHAAGNVPLQLHDWNVDFACWCSYKYLNAGPGAVAGCFVHERHGRNPDLPRFAGWWGNDPETRFQMHLERQFIPRQGADGWQISNPPILSMSPLKASLDIFDEAGMEALRRKSLLLTPYLRYLIEDRSPRWMEFVTPREPESHGCQLSMVVHDRPKERFKALTEGGIVCDFREPNVIRAAPVPLYNTFHECWQFSKTLAGLT